MKTVYQILFLIVVSYHSFSQTITSDELVNEVTHGRLLIFNDFALNMANKSFFKKVVDGKILKIERLDSISGLNEYGTIGAKGVIRIQIENLKVLKKENYRVVDASVLKYFVEDKQTFYFIDGLPNANIYFALQGLINREIKEIKILGANEAQAIWGSEGKNGAVMINTNGQIDLPMK